MEQAFFGKLLQVVGAALFLLLIVQEGFAQPPVDTDFPSTLKTIASVFIDDQQYIDGKRTVIHFYKNGSFQFKDNGVGELCQQGCDIRVLNDAGNVCVFHTDTKFLRVTTDPRFGFRDLTRWQRNYIFKLYDDTYMQVVAGDFLRLNGKHIENSIFECDLFSSKTLNFPSQ